MRGCVIEEPTMSDKPKAPEKGKEGGGSEGGAEAAPAKKGPPVKLIGIVGVVMIIEAVVVMMMFGGGPKDASAGVEIHTIDNNDADQLREIEVISDKFQNMQTGKVWIWDMSVFVQVKNKNAESVAAALELRKAEITEGINQIVSKAHHNHLKEPERQTLARQITVLLQRIIDSKTAAAAVRLTAKPSAGDGQGDAHGGDSHGKADAHGAPAAGDGHGDDHAAEDTSPLIERVLIPRCNGFPADF
jgi:hypothetical protein